MQTIGIDLGSNTLRAVLLGEKQDILWEYECVVRTAEGLSQEPLILPTTFQRLSMAMKEMKRDFYHQMGQDFLMFPYLAVATAALRKAKNRQDVLDMFKEEHGVLFQIIDPRAEALLTLNASIFALKQYQQIPPKPFFLVDIGGASTEISFYNACPYQYLDPFKNNDVDFFKTKSFDIGIVTLKESFFDFNLINKRIHDLIKEVQEWKKTHIYLLDEPFFIISGGVPDTIIALKQLQSDIITKQVFNKITLSDVLKQRTFYKQLTQEEQIAFASQARYDLIEVGMLLYEGFFEALNLKESIAITESLREGAALYAKSLF